MQITPDQIRAARAMLNLNQGDLAQRANKRLSTITEIERWDRVEPLDSADLLDVRRALEQDGIEFIPFGVRKLPPLTSEQQVLYEELRSISRQSGAELSQQDRLTDDDLYDESGLPA